MVETNLESNFNLSNVNSGNYVHRFIFGIVRLHMSALILSQLILLKINDVWLTGTEYSQTLFFLGSCIIKQLFAICKLLFDIIQLQSEFISVIFKGWGQESNVNGQLVLRNKQVIVASRQTKFVQQVPNLAKLQVPQKEEYCNCLWWAYFVREYELMFSVGSKTGVKIVPARLYAH